MADIKIYNGNTWNNTAVRKYETKSEIITPPTTIYADGTSISNYTIKGNTVQSGTPSPSNPVPVNGAGNATTNLFNAYNTWTKRTSADVVDVQDSGATISITTTLFCYTSVDVTANTDYVITCTSSGGIARNIAVYKSTSFTTENLIASLGATGGTFNSGSNTKLYVLFYASNNTQSATAIYSDVRLNTGNTAQPFEPYGFKIPISTAQGTTNIYLGSVSSTRQIQKLVITGEENWLQQSLNPYGIVNYSLSVSGRTQTTRNIACTHYETQTTTIDDTTSIGIFNGSNIFIRETYLDINNFKNYLRSEYANGTPVTIWYVLATAQTGIVNEPLMGFGSYADSLSNVVSIPTTDGANSITIDTTVQPSEFSATWTGWHDSTVKEWNGTDWQ